MQVKDLGVLMVATFEGLQVERLGRTNDGRNRKKKQAGRSGLGQVSGR